MVVFIPPKSTVYVVELRHLGHLAFCVPGGDGRTLKAILESDAIPKAFFDVRNASAALFAQHQITLGGVHDVQLMELATRQGDFNKRFVVGWDKCIAKDGGGEAFNNTLDAVSMSSLPRFNARILHLPVLWATYHARPPVME
ncbi:uncharacterized protein Z520_06783 [Fonsecaea multimorphosa CBS 102226]|uniref:3'-5' exonuclease domain-containing protein n=1 Tax=Fonsecaea multimorphosa CBS 102226 TaxID=1442371 RepID=A0A0D2IJT2_9EURO|nr:uncharacterized protein Z520_06783 [Fonsecaea multimorphosa CBS 102226]KIX97331.1 hypothetical protein Z520_06783 [Fonsecaea multimorphosa CBS 102226]